MPATAPSRPLWQVVVAGIIGNIMEWYDFALFGYFAPIIGALFFGRTTT
jgi:MHS family proline/betaine transporter-like MFS transporter